MNKKIVKLLRERDADTCWHCGSDDALTVQHRKNRGMGGSKLLDVPSNLILLCWWSNTEMEASRIKAEIALRQGWKVSNWADPKEIPVWHHGRQEWVLLDDNWGYTLAL
jgi:hypothetical protein